MSESIKTILDPKISKEKFNKGTLQGAIVSIIFISLMAGIKKLIPDATITEGVENAISVILSAVVSAILNGKITEILNKIKQLKKIKEGSK